MLNSLKKNGKGMLLILITALCLCVGQLLWKTMRDFDHTRMMVQFLLGFAICGGGGIAMTYAYRMGELSVIHPMNSISYVFSSIIAVTVLGEAMTAQKIIGVVVIIAGVILIGGSDEV
ncbi:MAG TPA: EamA family transporter [Oscillospiraceae bacterium]|nr:EamA family transporter [Oscillospiraceae bacterium]HPS75677.1 EamA family transporter [Oscillospiraceae bacterium]